MSDFVTNAENFLENLWGKAESLATAAAPIVKELEPAAEAVGSVVSTISPAAGSAIAAVTALVPAAVNDVTALTNAGRSAATSAGPAASDLISSILGLFHIQWTPTGFLATAKTTTATVPAPGKALS